MVAETQKSSLCGILGYAKAEESLVGSGKFSLPKSHAAVNTVDIIPQQGIIST